MIVADSPARSKTAGFKGAYHTGNICPYCPKHTDNFGTQEPWEDEPIESTLALASAPSALLVNTTYDGLPYFDRRRDSPPDPMHAAHIGICQRFWHKVLIDSCKDIRNQLEQAQHVIRFAFIPSSIKRPDGRIGDRGGGMPTAEQWVTLFRCLLPFIMLELWSHSLVKNGTQTLDFQPSESKGKYTQTRPIDRGEKSVKDIFDMGMLTCCIAGMLEGDFDEDDINTLRSYITRLNVKIKDTLGSGWVIFNNHITEHIPDAIREHGAPRNFSCLPFERYNGILGRINTSGHKGGQLELSMMRRTVHRLELRQLVAQSNDTFFRETLLGYIKSRSENAQPTPPTKLKRKELDSETYLLLLEHLNGPGKSFSGRFVVPHDALAPLRDVRVGKDATLFRTFIQDACPSEVRVSGYAAKGRKNSGNTFAMVKLPAESVVPVLILWIFEKKVQIHGPGTVAEAERYLHVLMLNEVTVEEAFGGEMPSKELLVKMKIRFARKDRVGKHMVLPLRMMISQLVIVSINTCNPRCPTVYGLKVL